MNESRPALIAALALACAAPRAVPAREGCARAGAYSFVLVDEAGRQLPTFEHQGQTYVLGRQGDRYLVKVRNETGRRVEVVASVDGRDVLDGRPATLARRGYLVAPFGEVTIDGFRLSGSAVAAFRFSGVEGSYAARMGDARDVGVVGVAVFPEAVPRPQLYDERAQSGGSQESQAPAAAPAPSSADGLASNSAGREERRKGLGTGFGEEHPSQVQEVPFERASARPEAVLSLRYNDRPGLLALGIDVDGPRLSAHDRWLRETAEPFRRDVRFAEPPPGW